jgi:hypothetical protein
VQTLACALSLEESVVATEKNSIVLMYDGIGMFVSSPQMLVMEGFAVSLPDCFLSHASSSDYQSSLVTNVSFFVGSPPNFEDCRCDIHGDGGCYKVEFTPHHDHGL